VFLALTGHAAEDADDAPDGKRRGRRQGDTAADEGAKSGRGRAS